MANQGYPNEGSDSRLTTLWGFGPWLSNLLTFKSGYDPVSVYIMLPLGFGLNIPVGKGRVFHFHLALWRYDRTAKEYIFFSADLKVEDHPIFY
jgi:hypothetical protein